MSSSLEDVRLELKLKNRHVIDIFHALRCDGQFSPTVSDPSRLRHLERHSNETVHRGKLEMLARVGRRCGQTG